MSVAVKITACTDIAPTTPEQPQNTQWFNDTDLRMTEQGKQTALKHIARIKASWAAEKQLKANGKDAQKRQSLRSKIEAARQLAQPKRRAVA